MLKWSHEKVHGSYRPCWGRSPSRLMRNWRCWTMERERPWPQLSVRPQHLGYPTAESTGAWQIWRWNKSGVVFEDGTIILPKYIRIYQDCFGHVIRCYQMSSYFGGIYPDLRVPVIIYIPHNGWSICYSFCVESGLFVTQSQYFMWKMYIPKNWVTSSFFQFCSQFRTVFFGISTPFQSFYNFNSKSLLNTLW